MICRWIMVATMPSSPRLPRALANNPVGQVRRFRAAAGKIKRHLREVRRWLVKQIDDIPIERIEVSSADPRYHVNERVYRYLISVPDLRRIIDELRRRVGDMPSDTVVDTVLDAYREGTGQAVETLRGLTDEYNRELTAVLRSDPWLRRVALIESRVFEQMDGFAADTGRDLARVLSQAVETGKNPMRLKRDLAQRFGVSESRAERIARTEVTSAYRRSRLDEAEDARDRLGIRTMVMHLSALLETTRPDHADRHGNLYTPQEAREWWADGGNSVNCRCSSVEVLVDEDGSPTTPGVVERVRGMR